MELCEKVILLMFLRRVPAKNTLKWSKFFVKLFYIHRVTYKKVSSTNLKDA